MVVESVMALCVNHTFANIEIILIIVIFVSGFFYPDNMDKTIITVTGKDTVGIIARICTILAENKVNILDITQTIVDGIFNMMMIVDTSRSVLSFEGLTQSLGECGEQLGVHILCQKEEIFDKMHRI